MRPRYKVVGPGLLNLGGISGFLWWIFVPVRCCASCRTMIRPFGWINSLVAMVVSMFRVPFPIPGKGGWFMHSEIRILTHVLFSTFFIQQQGMKRVLHSSRARALQNTAAPCLSVLLPNLPMPTIEKVRYS